jgi:hypothetical protein
MYAEELFALLSTDDLFIDQDEVTSGFRDHRGSYRPGAWEEDPEMLEYEEMLELGHSLGRWH